MRYRLAPFAFADLEQVRRRKFFLREYLVASFTFLGIKLLVTVALEARLLFVELSCADAAGDKANDSREFLVNLSLCSSLVTACTW